jgi:GNAT superfamily N-acetyltransferase
MSANPINATPWDAAPLGMHTAEITQYSEQALQMAMAVPGHYTIRVDPLVSKQLLHEYGFYYCDTLLEPHCVPARLVAATHSQATVSRQVSLEKLLPICHGAFVYGRFRRDFNLNSALADIRYDHWLQDLYRQKKVFGLYWQDNLAGFIAYSGSGLALHAVAQEYRGKGLAKFWWSAVCAELFAEGHAEIMSSISAANVAALNLYASLGFSFRNPQDIYHRIVK